VRAGQQLRLAVPFMSESSAEERTGTAKNPGESERLDNPPQWSPWSFQKQPDWHKDFYGEMRSRVEALPETAEPRSQAPHQG
jgi:hypothetical protein